MNKWHFNHVAVCFLKLYLPRWEKPYKNSHPRYWHPWLFQVQMPKALMEEAAHIYQSVLDRNKAVSATNS